MPNTDELIRSSFLDAAGRAKFALATLASYNKSDWPPFSQLHGLRACMEALDHANTEEGVIRAAREALQRPVHILMDTSLSSKDWDGAPLEIVSKARTAWRGYVPYLRMLARMARPVNVDGRDRVGDATGPAQKACVSVHFKRSIGKVYYRQLGKRRWQNWREASGEVILPPGSQYQLRISPTLLPFHSPKDLLNNIDLDCFEEIVIPARISSKDYMEQATSGRAWIEAFLQGIQRNYQLELGTRAKISMKAVIR